MEYIIRAPRKENGDKYVVEGYKVDEQFFHGLEELGKLKHHKLSAHERLEELSTQTGFSKLYEIETSPLVQLLNCVEDRITRGYEEGGKRILTGRDRHLPEEISKILSYSENLPTHFYRASNWVLDTDLAHTIASLDYAFDISESLGFEPQLKKIVISAMLVHDCAYPEVGSYDEFIKPEIREKHMENAVKEFKSWAREINRKFYIKFDKEYYTLKEIEQICSIVRQHDNPGVKIDFDYSGVDERLFFVHREADRLWMLDPAGFALDLLREIVEKGKYDPKARLEHVISKHREEAKVYENSNEEHKGKCKEYNGRKTLYRTEKGFNIFKELIEKLTRIYSLNDIAFTRVHSYRLNLQNFDCRACMFYGFYYDFEAEIFSCEKGHFNFIDYPPIGELPAETIGKTTDKSMQSDTLEGLTCTGEDFYFNPLSKWAGLVNK